MDLTTLLGLTLAFGMMAASVLLSGGRFSSFWNVPSAMVVLGGTAGAVLVSFPFAAVRRLPRVVRSGLRASATDLPELVGQIVRLAEIARRDGLLALDSRLDEIENPFVRLGVQLAVDGTRPEIVEDVLRAENESMSLRHKEGRAMIEQMGRFAPAFGMIGTLLGLIVMLGNMADPSTIGSGMAVALVTTLYGAILAHGCLLPLAERLSYLSKQELAAREIVLRGILAMQAGENPGVIEQKLHSFLRPEARISVREPRS
ncbi:MAG: motility protein A [Pirellulaceae bacterium]